MPSAVKLLDLKQKKTCGSRSDSIKQSVLGPNNVKRGTEVQWKSAKLEIEGVAVSSLLDQPSD